MRGFQLRYVLLVGGSLFVLLIFTGLHGVFVSKMTLPTEVMNRFWPTLEFSTIRLFVVGLVYIVVVSMAALFLSHRIAGPAYRLEEDIHQLSQSLDSVEELKIREGDELEGVVRALNELLKKLKKHE